MDDTRLIQAFEKVEKNCGDISLTYFEFITLAALVIFQQTDLDILILEVGLGGRLDAVNIVDATVAIITTIALDHTQWLGDSREAIATEKAGIFRPHQLAVCGDPNPPPNLAEIAQQLEIAFYQANRDFHIQYHLNTWDWQNAQQTWENLPIPQLPLQNAATALMAITLLLPHLPVTPKAIKEGLKKAFLPARFQQIGRYIIDVAHNPHAATWLAQQLQAHPCQGQTLAVVGMLADKDIAGTLAAIQPQIDAWYVGELPSPRAAKATLLQQHLRSLGVKICYHYASIEAALQAALAQSKPQDRIIVFGSFYTAQEALIFLQKEHDLYG
jgi:dihydrofolate synthase/folylpolyglutamate synthase